MKGNLSHHRVINSSTGAVAAFVDDGISVEIAIVTGTLFAAEINVEDSEGAVEFVDEFERNES